MSDLGVRIFNRLFQDRKNAGGMTFAVSSMTWAAVGGPSQAAVSVSGPETGECFSWVRSPIEIYDEAGPVWWGYVSEIEMTVGAVTFGVSLREMANRVKCVYNYVEAGTDKTGEQRETEWKEDAESVAEYGRKEMIVSLSNAQPAQAEAARNLILSQRKYPVVTARIGAAQEGVTLRCAGWWSTLEWKYYINADKETKVDAAEMIRDITQTCGQFFKGIETIPNTGIQVSKEYDGSQSAAQGVSELLKTPGINGKRLLVQVTPGRQVQVAEEPVFWQNHCYQLKRDGSVAVSVSGAPLKTWRAPVGVWYGLRDVMPATANIGYLTNADRFLAEEVSWNNGKISLRARDIPSPYDLFRINS